jgi:hypothetical protein
MAPVLEVEDVFRRHAEAFRQAREGHLGYVERRVMGSITLIGRLRSSTLRLFTAVRYLAYQALSDSD